MISSTPAYKAAIIGDSRRMYIKAKVHIVDPDIVYGSVSGTAQSAYSKPAQLYDDNSDIGTPYITLEPNRWLLDGTFDFAEDVYAGSEEIGYETDTAFATDGTGSQYCELSFSGVDVLQALTAYFPDNEYDGFPVDFTIDVYSGGNVEYTKSYSGNALRKIKLDGFTVNSPTKIKVTVTKWSSRRFMRVIEIIPGIHEEWSDDVIAEFSAVHQTNTGMTSLPYGTANIVFDNTDHRFDPYNKAGLFASLEDRQGIDLFLGVKTSGGIDYKKLGVFYQYADGWKIRNGLTIKWSLVDIIGLLAERPYKVPGTLPTKLSGWISDLVGQLGTNFANDYDIAAGYENTSLTAAAAALADTTCGQVLMWLCQASGLWATADPETGVLNIYPISDPAGNEITLANMITNPAITANEDIARIDFTLANNNTYSVSGNVDAAAVLSIRNPFLNDTTKADTAATLIMSMYGGNRIETCGRGDPTDELGDVLTIETENGDINGRLIYADYKYKNGVLTSCLSKYIEVSV